MRDFPPTNERRSQGLLRTYERSPRGPSAVLPRKSTPNTPRQQPNRYKTLPTRPKRPISASFARAGRTLYRRHHQEAEQGELCTAPSAKPGTKLSLLSRSRGSPGTKLSQHTHTSSPTGTKLSQHAQKGPFQPVLPEQGELCTARTTTTPSRENFVPHQAPNPVQNSPNTPTPAAQPVQNSPCSAGPGAHPVQNSPNTPKKAHFSPFYPSRENFVPLSPPRPPAGRTLYRSHHHDAQQGELCTAPSTTPGTKLSQHTHTSSPTGTKLSPHIQKSPFQPVLPEQGELCTASIPTTPSRENFVPHPAPPRHKTRPAHPHQQPNRYKTLPTRPKTPISASFARAGRTLYRSHHHDAQQGELCTAPSTKPGTKLSQRPVLQRFREKVRPAHPTPQQNREKVRPAHLKTAFFASFTPAGRNFSRTGKQQATQGELLRALGIEQEVLTKVVCADILGRRRRGLARLRDGAWLRRPWAAAEPKGLAAAAVGAGGTEGPGCGGRRRRRNRRAWLRRPWAAAGPGRASKSTSEPSGSRVAISRAGRRPRAHQAARPHSRIQQHLEHQLHPGPVRKLLTVCLCGCCPGRLV